MRHACEPIPPAELGRFLDGLVQHAMAVHHLAGVTIGVVQAGRIAVERGYGFADVDAFRRVDPASTLFRLGSITKTFTWIGVMKAVEAGRLRLDDPVNDRLPPDLRIPDDGFAEPIRLRDLLAHTAGFEDRSLGHLFEREPAGVRPLDRYLREERPARVREPGLFSSYSNYGVALGGAVLEHLHGRRWQDVVEAEILAPLGMTHTTPREPYPPRHDLPAPMPEPLARQLSNGYRWTSAGHEARGFEYVTQVAPAGAISSTARDMSRYMLMLLGDGVLDGVRIFGPEAASAFRTPLTSLPPDVGNWDAGFWDTRLPGGFRNIGHDGGTLSFFTSMVLAPELRLGVFAAANTEGGAALTGPLAARIVERFYTQRPRAKPAGSRRLVESAPAYEGWYLGTLRPYGSLEGFLSRMLQAARVKVTRDGYLVLRMGGSGQRFAPADRPDVFRPVETGGPFGGLLFRRSGDRAYRIEMRDMALERIGPVLQPPTLTRLCALTLLVSAGTVAGAAFGRRDAAQTRGQQIARSVQTSAAAAWLATAGAAALSVGRAGDSSELIYRWPTPAARTSSAAALGAAALSAASALLVPAVWRDGADGWRRARKIRFTAASAVFGAFGALLAGWGALQPWKT